MDLEIQTRECDLRPEWRQVIEDWVAKLSARFPRMLRLHVRLQRSRHHRHGTDEVHLLANLPGRTVTAAKRGADMVAATHAAFEGLGRGLAALSEKGRRVRGERRPPPGGTPGDAEEEGEPDSGVARSA
jgi:ribosome-associated translation inhibitor RaiA